MKAPRATASAKLQRAAGKVYALIHDPRGWAKWTVWNQRDPAMKMSYAGAPSGQGARWSWESRTEGSAGTAITWSNEGEFGANPYMHYFALLMDRRVYDVAVLSQSMRSAEP